MADRQYAEGGNRSTEYTLERPKLTTALSIKSPCHEVITIVVWYALMYWKQFRLRRA
jgi:hypothetical protein